MRRMTTGEVAAALNLAAPTVQKYAREGRIPFEVTPGGHRRFDLDEVRLSLFDTGPRGSQRPALVTDGSRLGAGPPLRLGAHGAFEHAVRATHPGTADASVDEAEGPSAIDRLVGHARHLVGSTLR